MTTHSSRRQRTPLVRLISFGFLHSAPPAEAHAVFDLREHFHDPHLAPDLRALTSSNPRVREHVLATPGIGALVDAITATALAMASGPARADVVIAIGCAGGRHRAPTVAREVAERLEEVEGVDVQLDPRHITRPVVER
ncbi:RNase adapter RapZ [Nocardiopsis alba]|uniref:RapZ C-terminal domain-containing protein n=1 Tax=Nocardiopsis alba TaxID=53437 RepID=UPI0033ACF412